VTDREEHWTAEFAYQADDRPHLSAPGRIAEGIVAATDGRVLAWSLDDTAELAAHSNAAVIADIITSPATERLLPMSRSDLLAWCGDVSLVCPACRGREPDPCPECCGEGEVDCRACGYSRPCDRCRGRGTVEPVCSDCGGSGATRLETRTGWLGATLVDRARLRPLVEATDADTLEVERVDVRDHGWAVRWTTARRGFLLMGVRPTVADAEKPRIGLAR
jgi:hypothetical protein